MNCPSCGSANTRISTSTRDYDNRRFKRMVCLTCGYEDSNETTRLSAAERSELAQQLELFPKEFDGE